MTSVTAGTVGATVAAMCTKCKAETEHTVATVIGDKIGNVVCKVCEKSHRFRKPGAKRPSTRRRTAKTSPEETWTHRMESASSRRRTAYSPAGAYQVDDVIEHSHFGVGIVTMLTAKDKIQVAFKDGSRILIMGMRAAV